MKQHATRNQEASVGRRRIEGPPRQSIAVRTRTDLKQRLESAAAASGKSLAQEVEDRLEKTFAEPHGEDAMTMEEAIGFFALQVGGDYNLSFSLAVGALLHFVEMTRGKSWRSDEDTKREVERLLLEQIPRWIADPPARIDERRRELLEKQWDFLLRNVKRAKRVGNFGDDEL
jgi:hypothetical protein